MEKKLSKGVFISFEGPEGSGKSTHSERIFRELTREGFDVVKTAEPGGTDLGAFIRRILLNEEDIQLSHKAELFLFEADRAQHISEMISPALDEGKIVLCDRFNTATFAYQGYGLGMDSDDIKKLDDIATSGIRPDVTFILDVDVVTGLKRAGKTGVSDRMENRDASFHEKVRLGYLDIAKKDPSRYVVVDANKDREEVFVDIRGKLNDFIGKFTGARQGRKLS